MRERRDCPECRWVTVVDETGRRRYEMRWEMPAPVSAVTSLARAA